MAMTPEAKVARARYMREWRKRNPEKQKEYMENMWQKKADQREQEREESEGA